MIAVAAAVTIISTSTTSLARSLAQSAPATRAVGATTATHALGVVQPASELATVTYSLLPTAKTQVRATALGVRATVTAATRVCSRVARALTQRVSGYIDGVAAATSALLAQPQDAVVLVDITARLQELHTQLKDNLAAEAAEQAALAAQDAADADASASDDSDDEITPLSVVVVDAARSLYAIGMSRAAGAAAFASLAHWDTIDRLQRQRATICSDARRLVEQLGSAQRCRVVTTSHGSSAPWWLRGLAMHSMAQLMPVSRTGKLQRQPGATVDVGAVAMTTSECTLVPVVSGGTDLDAAARALGVSALLCKALPAATNGCDAMASWLSTSPVSYTPLAGVAGRWRRQYAHTTYDGIKAQYRMLM
jgi:hypothetical protein